MMKRMQVHLTTLAVKERAVLKDNEEQINREKRDNDSLQPKMFLNKNEYG